MDNLRSAVQELIIKASKVEKSDDALKFSQAACNAANAICALVSVSKEKVD